MRANHALLLPGAAKLLRACAIDYSHSRSKANITHFKTRASRLLHSSNVLPIRGNAARNGWPADQLPGSLSLASSQQAGMFGRLACFNEHTPINRAIMRPYP